MNARVWPVCSWRTAIDYAHVLRDLADIHFPNADKITFVHPSHRIASQYDCRSMDNLNTQTTASLCEAFPPAEASRIAERFEWHYTPKHGSWLNIAECELSVLARQCLDRRIPDQKALEAETTTWPHNRNSAQAKVNWHFNTDNARTKLA